MKVFTIENQTNNITVHATIHDAEAVANAERFRNEAGLNKLAADWPAARLVEIWNSLSRPTGDSRYFNANLVARPSINGEGPFCGHRPPLALIT
jgi:hypothetical protein